jgi:hypothetical protein
MRTDGQTDRAKVIGVFCNLNRTPRNGETGHLYKACIHNHVESIKVYHKTEIRKNGNSPHYMHNIALNCTTSLKVRNEETNSIHYMQNYSLDYTTNRNDSTANLPIADRTNSLIFH